MAESDIPPRREKCSGQAGLPGSLPPCAETLAGEDVLGVRIPLLSRIIAVCESDCRRGLQKALRPALLGSCFTDIYSSALIMGP